MGESSAVVYRSMRWSDLEDVVGRFDQMWGDDVPTAGSPVSLLMSRYYVLHYLAPSTHCEVATLDGRFMGVLLTRVVGDPVAFPQAEGERQRAADELKTTAIGAEGLRYAEYWRDVEIDLERSAEIGRSAQAELELFLVAAGARGHGIGGHLWGEAMRHLASRSVGRYYLHTDSACDVGYYEAHGLSRDAERPSAEHPEDVRAIGSALDDLYIYAGDVPAAK
ncbi:GNAT family N-acetyltransferase [Bifidobacterium sp. ESL0763]|uniref:GNAT family N-acetyltransferase n=1 Tax=Bifidobacterium sp. ESL0763 TaxID=2983227 RepID=UPI0023F78D21|nr:GNAT family N-acetyltransferase [Bifidobacterium sp. ESL0763]MDF7664283.1 GNAT family N-acetyltransferase [Bifidobacterium sp. ESL0763]